MKHSLTELFQTNYPITEPYSIFTARAWARRQITNTIPNDGNGFDRADVSKVHHY
jgi:hypothetical protein